MKASTTIPIPTSDHLPEDSKAPNEDSVFAVCTIEQDPDRCTWTEAQYFQLREQISAYKNVYRGIPISGETAQKMSLPSPATWNEQRQRLVQSTSSLYKYRFCEKDVCPFVVSFWGIGAQGFAGVHPQAGTRRTL